jgi:hypothetical protein
MVNKKTWLGILVLVLVFGITVVGCSDGSTDASDSWNQFVGVWQDGPESITFYPNLSAYYRSGYNYYYEDGVYKYNGNTATFVLGTLSGIATLKGSTSLEITWNSNDPNTTYTRIYTKQ